MLMVGKFVDSVTMFRDWYRMSWCNFVTYMCNTLQILFVAPCYCVSRDESRERSRKKSPDRSRKPRREEKEEKEFKRKKKSVSSEDEKIRRKRRQDSRRWELGLTDIKCVNNSFHLARKHARIFVPGHYLFRDIICTRGKCELQGADNVQGQISEHIFPPNGGYWVYYAHEIFFVTRAVLKIEKYSRIFSDSVLVGEYKVTERV